MPSGSITAAETTTLMSLICKNRLLPPSRGVVLGLPPKAGLLVYCVHVVEAGGSSLLLSVDAGMDWYTLTVGSTTFRDGLYGGHGSLLTSVRFWAALAGALHTSVAGLFPDPSWEQPALYGPIDAQASAVNGDRSHAEDDAPVETERGTSEGGARVCPSGRRGRKPLQSELGRTKRLNDGALLESTSEW